MVTLYSVGVVSSGVLSHAANAMHIIAINKTNVTVANFFIYLPPKFNIVSIIVSLMRQSQRFFEKLCRFAAYIMR